MVVDVGQSVVKRGLRREGLGGTKVSKFIPCDADVRDNLLNVSAMAKAGTIEEEGADMEDQWGMFIL